MYQIPSTALSFGGSTYIINTKNIPSLYKTLKQALPNVKLFYSIKSNDHKHVLDAISQFSDVGFAVVSQRECQKVLPYNKNVIFSMPYKYEDEIEFAASNGIASTVVETPDEVEKISRVANKLGRNIEILIRIKTLNPAKPDPLTSVDYNAKFGISSQGAKDLLAQYGKHSSKLIWKGISFHAGYGEHTPTAFYPTLQETKNIFTYAHQNNIHTFDTINIGGGFSTLLKKGEIFAKSCDEIERGRNFFFSNGDVQFIAEPGIFFAETCADAVLTIMGKKLVDGVMYYYSSSTWHGIFREYELFQKDAEPVPLRVEKKRGDEKIYPSVIFGPVCAANDSIFKNRLINLEELHINDKLIMKNVGAYTLCHETFFNLPMLTKILSV